MLLEHQDVISEFCSPSWWNELSKKTSSKILLGGDGSYWKTFNPIASLIVSPNVPPTTKYGVGPSTADDTGDAAWKSPIQIQMTETTTGASFRTTT
ncbi:hypothetical protein Tco_0070524 [Tanacetum coccineum]